MSDFIRDGSGSGFLAEVDSENRLRVRSDSIRFATHVNETEGEYYTLTISNTATAADDCIGYVKNTASKDLHIESIFLFSAAATLLSIKLKDTGTPDTPATLTPVNCNSGSNNEADGTFYSGVELDKAGALSGGVTVLNWYTGASDGKLLDFFPHVIVVSNGVATFYVNQNTQAVIIGLGMYYH